MAEPKVGRSSKWEVMHYSVGAVIENDGKYLLIDRVKPPLGFAGVAGHIDEGEDEVTALLREVGEESGLTVVRHRLLFEEELDWNECSKGVRTHYWYLFECEVEGDLGQNVRETRFIGWYLPEEIRGLTLEPVWKYWFDKRGII